MNDQLHSYVLSPRPASVCPDCSRIMGSPKVSVTNALRIGAGEARSANLTIAPAPYLASLLNEPASCSPPDSADRHRRPPLCGYAALAGHEHSSSTSMNRAVIVLYSGRFRHSNLRCVFWTELFGKPDDSAKRRLSGIAAPKNAARHPLSVQERIIREGGETHYSSNIQPSP